MRSGASKASRSDARSSRVNGSSQKDGRSQSRERGKGGQGRASKTPASAPQKQPVAPAGNGSMLDAVLNLIVAGIAALGRGVIALFKGIGAGFTWLWSKSKIAGGALTLILVLVCAFAIDGMLTQDKAYRGVFVGDVDVAGMDQEQAASAITARYGDKLASTKVYIFTSEEAAKNTNVEEAGEQGSSSDGSLGSKVLWVESADTLNAKLPSQELAAEAIEFGRSTGVFDRFSTLMHEHVIEPRIDYSSTILDNLISDLDSAIGDPVQEFSISIDGTTASVKEGHDGYMIDKPTFVSTLTDKLLNSEVDDPRYIPQAEYVSLNVDEASAQKTADAINDVLSEGTSFAFGDKTAEISAETLGSWIETSAAQRGDEWYLKPQISTKKALDSLKDELDLSQNGEKHSVTFQVSEDGVQVTPDGDVNIPTVGASVQSLDDILFGSFYQSGIQKVSGDRYGISIQSESSSGPISVEEALTYGVVSKFSTYTTRFDASDSNRVYNVQKAADLIDDSIIKANGGRWSFNETAGDCNAEAGFKEAGVISGDEMTEEAGGGVCQIATTVFNSVYESGLPIAERHNHSLSSSNYPDGRDAAIAYPTLDLIWENDTSSDILLQASYDSNSVTVDLIGEDPELEVITDTGEWGEGDKYKVKVEVDDTYADYAVVKMTNGSDGSTINVTRTVKDAQGNQVRQETYSSVYSPVNVVVKVGKEVDVSEIQQRYARPDDANTKSSSSSTSGTSTSQASQSSSSSSSSSKKSQSA